MEYAIAELTAIYYGHLGQIARIKAERQLDDFDRPSYKHRLHAVESCARSCKEAIEALTKPKAEPDVTNP